MVSNCINKGKIGRIEENRKITQNNSFEKLLLFIFLPLTQTLVVHSYVLLVHEIYVFGLHLYTKNILVAFNNLTINLCM